MRPAIRVENLGKCYQVARTADRTPYRTLRESLANLVTAPMRRFRNAGSENEVEPFWALRDVNFEVQPGEVVGIIGRNGAGKSTLLKILSRITKPTTGRVELNGRVGSLLEVGTGFHPELTGRENIYLNGSILGMSRREIARRFDEIVSFAEVERFLDTPVKRYSSGMYVRLAFAVAAHLEPEILIVDEVLAVGDIEFQKRCLDKMNTVSRSGRTILFVSHNMAAVENLCTSGMLLSGGRIRARGELPAIICEYHNTDRIAGESEINLATHPNRRGGPTARLLILQLSSNGIPSAAVRMGEALELTIKYDCREKPVDLRIGITITDHRGIRVVNFTPYWQAPALLNESKPRGVLRCSIPQLPLVEGHYSVSVYYDDGYVSEGVENACELRVLTADVFRTGRPPEARHGLVFINSKWSSLPFVESVISGI